MPPMVFIDGRGCGAARPTPELVPRSVAAHARQSRAISPGTSAPLGHVVKQVVHHVGVGTEIARGKQHGLLGVQLQIFSVRSFCVRAQHRIAVQLEGDGGMLPIPHGPQPLRFAHAVGFKLGDTAHLLAAFDELRVRHRALSLERGRPGLVPGKLHRIGVVRGIAIGNLDDALIVIEVEGVARIGSERNQIVHHLTGVLYEQPDDGGAHAPHASAGVLGHDVADIVRAESVLEEHLRVVAADILAEINIVLLVLHLDDGHARAVLRGGKRRLGPGVTASEHDDVNLYRVVHVSFVYNRHLAEPVFGAYGASDQAHGSTALRRCVRGSGCAVATRRLRGTPGKSKTGGGQRARGKSAFQEVAPIDALPPLLHGAFFLVSVSHTFPPSKPVRERPCVPVSRMKP